MVLIEDEQDLKIYYQAMREILKVSSIDLKYYFTSLFPEEKTQLSISGIS